MQLARGKRALRAVQGAMNLLLQPFLKSQAVAVSYTPARVLRMSKFSLANATPGTKRTESQAMGAPSKIPKVSQLKKETPREKPERVVTNGPLKICIRKYSDRAGDLWAQFKALAFSIFCPLYFRMH